MPELFMIDAINMARGELVEQAVPWNVGQLWLLWHCRDKLQTRVKMDLHDEIPEFTMLRSSLSPGMCSCLLQKLSEQTEFVSKEIYTELLQSFAKLEKHSISLEIALQNVPEQLKNVNSLQEKGASVF
ncbi:hypothetical protein Tco_0785990 [Tanacetum coccineum]